MRILVVGASGRSGNQVVLEALRRNHTVTALVRTPTSLDKLSATLAPEQKSNLHIVTGSPLNASEVATAVATASADHSEQLVVVSALNSRRTSESPWAKPHPTDSPPRMMADSIANVAAALKQANMPKAKIVHISVVGVGASQSNAFWLLRFMIMHSNVKLTYDDHAEVEKELKNSSDAVDWVVVRPGRLTEGDDGSKPKVWPAEKGMLGAMAKCSRGALAKFCLDAAETKEWDGKDPIILS